MLPPSSGDRTNGVGIVERTLRFNEVMRWMQHQNCVRRIRSSLYPTPSLPQNAPEDPVMKYKYVGFACVALFIGGSIANAQVDFGKLLGSIDFSDDESKSDLELPEELPAPAIRSDLDQDLLAAPEKSYEDLERLVPPSISPEIESDSDAEMDLGGQPNTPRRQSDMNELRAIPELPSQTPMATTQTTVEPEPMQYDSVCPKAEPIDLQVLASDFQPAPANAQAACAPSVLEGSVDDSTRNGNTFQQCGHCSSCGSRAVRVPPCLTAPDLPPPSSFEATYRTPSYYRGLWSGYGQQKAIEAAHHHKHILGTCDCEQKSLCNHSRCLPQ